jgi:hypothetical protein
MQPIPLDENAKDLVLSIRSIIDTYWWAGVIIFLGLLFREQIMQFIFVMSWKLGRRYNERMPVIVNGRFARIAKIGLFYVEFYLYNKISEPPERGVSWMVAGNRLNGIDIWIPLENHVPLKEPFQSV